MPPIRSTTTPGPGELEPKQSPPSSPINQHSNDNDANSSNDEPFSPQLRDYQQKAVDAFMEGRERGLTRIGLSAPTGAGKTIVFAAIIKQELSKYSRKKALVVVNSEELAEQANEKILNVFEERVQIGYERGTWRAPARSHVIITTWQTLGRPERMKEFKKRFNIADFKLVVVDEAHHSAADSYLRILSEFNNEVESGHCVSGRTATIHGHKIPILGVSATFVRNDYRALEWVFEEVVHACSLEDMWAAGHLVTIKIWKLSEQVRMITGPTDKPVEVQKAIYPPVPRRMDGSKKEDGEFGELCVNDNDYQEAMKRFNRQVLEYYQAQAKGRKSTLVFCAGIGLVEDLALQFQLAGVETRSLSTHTHAAERNRIVNSFRKGDFPVLINCMMLIEGYDAPQIDCIVLARPTESVILHNQMIGRATRLSPKTGKTDCLVIDLVGNCDRFPLGVGPNLQSKERRMSSGRMV